jgi:peptidyl-prolyl cis-trans isomerase C
MSAFVAIGGIALAAPASVAEDSPGPAAHDPAEVIAYQGDVTLTQREIDAALDKLPEPERLVFVRDGAKVEQLIRALLQRKAIAGDARQAGYDRDPLIAARMALEAERELAEAWYRQLMAEMPPADYEALAREEYLANPDRYRTAEVLDVSHILIGTEERTVAEARAVAESLADRLQSDPSAFDGFVEQYSDDPAKINNGGRYRDMQRGMMAAQFENAAFALGEPGAISKPVQTDYGWHIVRLNGRSGNERQSFEAVREEAVAEARRKHLDQYRERYLRRIQADPIVVPEGAAENLAKRHFGENLELAPGVGQ